MMKTKRFESRVALVTGAAAGIGKATAERLAAEGARLVIADYNYPEAERLAEQLNREGAPAFALRFDASETESCREIVARTIERYGTIDILVNNVGGSDLSRDLDLLNMDLGYFDEVFHLNLRSVMATTQAALSEMTLRNRGSIVNTASIGGLLGDFRGTLYGAAKAGVIGLTRYIASQYGKLGIRCNAVAPGLVLTPPPRGRCRKTSAPSFANTTPSTTSDKRRISPRRSPFWPPTTPATSPGKRSPPTEVWTVTIPR